MKYILGLSWKVIVVFATICSIVSILSFVFQSSTMAIIALSIFCFFLIAVIIVFIIFLNKYITVNFPDSYVVNFIYLRYTTDDGDFIEYETYKSLQSKRPVLTSYDYGFKWSGTHAPVISSDLQTISSSISVNHKDYDKVELSLGRPLLMNQTEIIHFRAKLDDSDKKSKTHLEVKILHAVRVIHFRAELRYKDAKNAKPATIKRKPISSITSHDFEIIGHVPFIHKMYEYQLLNPEPGYFYRIAWDR